ncbi:hypothetical protein [Bauldia sp.]|uniref:hypothetical protein n=1 Tax=Bauldia sp. TaxID=2575872 RepID=UPI003BAA3C64
MFKFGAVIGFIGKIAQICALIKIINLYFGCEYFNFFIYILDAYTYFVDFVFENIEPILHQMMGFLFNFDFTPYEQWRHIFVFLSIYYASEVKTDFNRKPRRPINGWVNIILGTIITVATSVVLGLVPAESSTDSFFLAIAAPAGFLVFAMSATLLTTTFYRPDEQNWSTSFAYNLRTTLFPYIAFYFFSVFAAFAINSAAGGLLGAIASIPIFVFLASIWWLGRGIWLSIYDRGCGERQFNRFIRAGGTKTAFSVLIVIIGTVSTAVLFSNKDSCLV